MATLFSGLTEHQQRVSTAVLEEIINTQAKPNLLHRILGIKPRLDADRLAAAIDKGVQTAWTEQTLNSPHDPF